MTKEAPESEIAAFWPKRKADMTRSLERQCEMAVQNTREFITGTTCRQRCLCRCGWCSLFQSTGCDVRTCRWAGSASAGWATDRDHQRLRLLHIEHRTSNVMLCKGQWEGLYTNRWMTLMLSLFLPWWAASFTHSWIRWARDNEGSEQRTELPDRKSREYYQTLWLAEASERSVRLDCAT